MIETPSDSAPGKGTVVFDEFGKGETHSSAELLPLVYQDLQKLAAIRLARLGSAPTLRAIALVHEAYVWVTRSGDPGWQGPAHFLGAATLAMRDILADHLQREASLKRGGHLRRIGEYALTELSCDGPSNDVLAFEEALEVLGRGHPRKAKVVTLTFFGGLTGAEIDELLNLSTRTVERDWRFAKAWLNARLGKSD